MQWRTTERAAGRRRSGYGLSLALMAAFVCTAPLSAQVVRTALQPKVTTATQGAGFQIKTQQLAIPPAGLDVSKFAFTAPGRIAAGHSSVTERGFTFTPSRTSRNGLSVGASVRAVTPPADATRTAAADSGLTPSGYDFDLSVGYRGFALSGGMSHIDTGLGGRNSDGVDVGLGYGAGSWHAGLQATAEREQTNLMPRYGFGERYTVEARGALDLSSKISVGGTLRYRPPLQNPTPLDPLKSDRALIVGGAVTF